MSRRFLSAFAAVLAAAFGCGITPAAAQGLIWSLPAEEATSVRFEGTYKNKQARPNANDGDLELQWRCELTIKSLGRQMAEWNGEQVPCRWVEFKSVIKPENLETQPGPYGTKIYKVLIPEGRVIGRLVDGDGIPVTFIPIVKGYRKVADREAVPVTEKVLSVYPMISLVTHYRDLKPEAEKPEELSLEGDIKKAVLAQLNKGTHKLENDTSRSTNEGQLWLSKDIPFGVAKMQVKVTREEKDSTAPLDEFKQIAEISVDLAAVEIGGAEKATSELPDLQ